MPVVRGLMQTAARPLIYKLWKRSKTAVLALAAIKKLHDDGDPQPLVTIERMSNVDVPMQFLKRIAWDAGLHDIPGVSPDRKPGLMPHAAYVGEDSALQTDETLVQYSDVNESGETVKVYHVTFGRNVPSIQKIGLEPRIGPNSAAIGEEEAGVHVFYDIDSAEDATANWDMDWSDDEDEPLTLLGIDVPREWVDGHWESHNGGHGIIMHHIAPDMISIINPNF